MNDVINRKGLKQFVASAMSQHSPVDKMKPLITEEALDLIEAEMISTCITHSRQFSASLRKIEHTKHYQQQAKENKRIT